MDWVKSQFRKLADSLINSTQNTFWWRFSLGTLLITITIMGAIYYIMDAFSKSHLLPDNPGMLILNLFLIAWILVMILTASFLFTYGGHLVRYDIPSDRLDSLKESGLIYKADERIWLIGLSLYPFTSEGWKKILEDKIKNSVSVKLLIFRPDTEFAATRPSSLRRGDQTLADDINKAIEEFTAFKKDLITNYPTYADKFEIRLYSGNASMSAFILDDEARVGLYIDKNTGLSAPEIRLVNKGGQADIFSKIEGHFETVWAGSDEAIVAE